MAKVVAISRGYFDGLIREPGDTFSVSEGISGLWFKPVDQGYALAENETQSHDPVAGEHPKGRIGRKAKAEADHVRASNKVNDQTGGTQPDWIASDTDI